MAKTKNNFDSLKSKIKELYIPLPNFTYFHKPSSEEDVFDNFIGREEISEQLEEWLTEGDSGAYLVTGYRGAGKSSFVGKVLRKITRKSKKNKWVTFFTGFCLLFIISFVSLLFTVFLGSNPNSYNFSSYFTFAIENTNWILTIRFWVLIISIAAIAIMSIYDKWWRIRNMEDAKKQYFKDYPKHKTWFEKVFGIRDIKENKHNIVIKLNLGHESLKERDILSLIAKRIHAEYKEYLSNFYTNGISLIVRNSLLFVGAILMVWLLDTIYITQIITKDPMRDNTSSLFIAIHNFFKLLIGSPAAKITTKLLLTTIFYFIVRWFYYFIVSKIHSLRKHSSKAILKNLKFLIDRIDASVGETSVQNIGSVNPVINYSRQKNKTYPYASTREIEEELIQILRNIQIARSLMRPLHQAPKFIIVFDELDKIDPVYNQVIRTEQDVPEFEASSDFQGNSPIRNRKQNVLKLLGNMKLFMSQVCAKFIFISGRELYDAFLADLTDREFAASSIFNGVIYVDSFLKSSTKEKNILTKTEEYICGYLIPKKWYISEAQKQYNKEKGKDNSGQELENHFYRSPNLRMYKKFLTETLLNNNFIGYQTPKNFENYKEYKSYYENTADRETKNQLDEIEQRYLFIDKVTVFLNQFSFYLTHVCNGSPKKITLYFEKYIKSFFYGNQKNPFSKCFDNDIKDSKHCLTFTAKDQQQIGFIYYMGYPLVQTIINRASHFGDKMLVSTSFLIDHIFKHHKGGFSYENIELTPELLEVYHIPNLRDIIDDIFSFLRQNYITDICGGIYQYKFRRFIADEIRYNSRISEEISAIFNFTLDESLPIKRYYYKQIKENEKKYLKLEERVGDNLFIKNQYAITLATQLEVLGEIHLSDEEYNEAMQHLQTAFEIIKTELEAIKTDKDKLQFYTLLIRVVLKLGLAKECKGYYDDALVIYNTLIDYLTEFKGGKEKFFYCIVAGISRMMSAENKEVVSRFSLFSEVRSIFQVIIANLFIVEKKDLNGITQENINLAQQQCYYIHWHTDCPDKFIQFSDFHKKIASILFLKNYTNTKEDWKCEDCQNSLENRGKNHPCEACKYISESLKIFKTAFDFKNYQGSDPDTEADFCKEEPSFGFISDFFRFLSYIKKSKTPNNNLFVLASALRIKADTLLSCVNKNDNKIESKFLNQFLNFNKKYYNYGDHSDIKETVTTFSKLEKAILYYWLSAEYSHLNGSTIDSSECLIKILLIFDKYIEINKEPEKLNKDKLPFCDNDSQMELFEDIQNTIVRRILRNINITNDNVSYIELQNLKYILRNRVERHINLSNLSSTPNVEDVLFAYCKLELNSIDLGKNLSKTDYDKFPICFDCYKSTLVSPNAFSFTTQERLLSMEFKSKMNMAIFDEIVCKAGYTNIFNTELIFYRDSNGKKIFKSIYFLFLEFYFERVDIKDFKHLLPIRENNTDTKKQLLQFLIGDSLYCLTQIVEILSSGKFSNFSHSFIGDIYHQISKWATFYQRTFLYLTDKEYIMLSKNLENNILNDLGAGNRHFLEPTYSVRMAIRHYRKALEVHNEGREYKEMIKKMYIIDDDITNGMHNFSLALERYTINCGVIDEKMRKLKAYYKESLSYPLGNYLEDTSED